MQAPREGLAARAGRWSAAHRKTAIFGWIAFVLVSAVIGGMVGMKTLTDEETGSGDSGRADKTLSEAFPEGASESVLVQTRGHGPEAGSPRFRAAVDDVATRLERVEGVRRVETPYERGAEDLVSEDGRSALVQFEIAGDEKQSEERVDATLAQVAAAQRDHGDLRIEEFGDASVGKAIGQSYEDDFRKAEITSVPITLVILIVAFGALVAAGLPLLLALTAVAGTLGIVSLVSQIAPVEEAISSVILLIGLAVGVDYCLFYIRREREERAAGRGEQAALEAAAATSGRAVLVSGLTVMIAMAGMYLSGNAVFTSFATGTIIVVAVAMVGSVTVLPALLSKLGDRVDKGRIPFLGPRRGRQGGGLWSAVVERVLRRPGLSAALSAGVLVALAIPAFGLQTAFPGVEDMPRDNAVMKTYDRIQEAFPGQPLAAEVVVRGDVRSAEAREAIAELRERALATDTLRGPVTEQVSRDGRVAAISVPMLGDGADELSNRALDDLRQDVVPATLERAGLDADVTGMTAGSRDFADQMESRIPLVFAFVLGMAFLLLLVTFRSVVIPLKAIALNLLSVGAAYGLLVLVFQEGVGASLLGVEQTAPVVSWLPLFLFVVLFGLSMDYHVFILSRVKEARDGGMSTSRAVAHGIRSTAGAVTSAAAVMVAVFGIFATLSAVDFKQMGVGLAAAVLIDATIVRAVLLPAAMKLLGDWNWYLPRWLEWLPRVGAAGRPHGQRPARPGEPAPEPSRA